ncbi:MAG: insulinase family protein [Clostridiales bacterium]|nr:insulinase family protein [Clostridiales bacterium]
MKKDYYRKLDEKVISHNSANGLNTFVFPKKGFHRSYAMLAVNYGSIDSEFRTGTESFVPPKGVAHFLEHKVFEQPDGGNALQIFARHGATPNAFTSKSMTCYFFSCTEGFYQNLEVLLNFVTTPYFTAENVKKEQGIISEEIKMVNDKPGWRVFENLMSCLYSVYPARDSIIGTKESITRIDRDTLFKCYNTFYIPSNMVLVTAGDIEAEKVISAAESILPKDYRKPPERFYGYEPADTKEKYIEKQMQTPLPVFSLGYRRMCETSGAEGMRARAVWELAAEIIAGNSSPLYSSLYLRGLINSNFGAGIMTFPGSFCMMFSGESRDPQKVYEEISAFAAKQSLSIDESYFNRIKKSYYGMTLRNLDMFDALCREQVSCCFDGYMYYDFINEIENIEIRDIIECINLAISDDNMALSVISPNKEA